jgi:hypothetical protein
MDRKTDTESLDPKASDEDKDSVGKWARDNSYFNVDILFIS